MIEYVKKNGILMALYVLAFISGVVGEVIAPGNPFPPSTLPVVFIGAALSFMWYCHDSKDIGYRRGKMLNVGIVALGILAFPYYFFSSRGFLKGIKYTCFFLCIAVLWNLVQVIGATVVSVAI